MKAAVKGAVAVRAQHDTAESGVLELEPDGVWPVRWINLDHVVMAWPERRSVRRGNARVCQVVDLSNGARLVVHPDERWPEAGTQG